MDFKILKDNIEKLYVASPIPFKLFEKARN